ncbi:hypothetical protein LDENG_00075620 [Lucifuga dentata]|nr:hypothetical protein LDENG_00075620 [Lucifuga dentata]
MDSQTYCPSEGVQMQMIQHTNVNIEAELPRDHLVWSICCLVYGNPCCLGLMALINSVKARDRKIVGDVEGARHYGSTARCYNIISTILTSIGILSIVVVIIVLITNIFKALEVKSSYGNYRN